jgi:hypothetical protein
VVHLLKHTPNSYSARKELLLATTYFSKIYKTIFSGQWACGATLCHPLPAWGLPHPFLGTKYLRPPAVATLMLWRAGGARGKAQRSILTAC